VSQELAERSPSTMFERRHHALTTGLLLLAVAAVMTIVVIADPTGSPLQPLDDRWLSFMENHRTAWLTRAAKTMSTIGSATVTFPLRALVVVVLLIRRRWLQLGAFVGATVCAELCIGPLKAIVDRPRPVDALLAVDSASFPSGHAIAAAVTALGLVFVLVPASPRRLLWIGFAAAFAALMALSRTYLGVHWLSDVLAGACIGTGFALVWPAGLELLRARRRGSSPERVGVEA
jgi:membrane-associated phospholipid phosphatase